MSTTFERLQEQARVYELAQEAAAEENKELTRADVMASATPIEEVEEVEEDEPTLEALDAELKDDEDLADDSDEENEVIDPLSIIIDDEEINKLDEIDPEPFTKDRSERYKTITHSSVLVCFEQNLQAQEQTYERKAIWTTHSGAIMTAEYSLTDTIPNTSVFIRNSYNGSHALGMIVGIEGEHLYVFNDYKTVNRRHTKNADLQALVSVAVSEITTEFQKGKTLLAVMDNTIVQKHYDYVLKEGLTQRDVIWHTFVEQKALPITLLPKVVQVYNELVDANADITLLKMYQILSSEVKKTNTRDRVVMQHRNLMTAMLASVNSKKEKLDE